MKSRPCTKNTYLDIFCLFFFFFAIFIYTLCESNLIYRCHGYMVRIIRKMYFFIFQFLPAHTRSAFLSEIFNYIWIDSKLYILETSKPLYSSCSLLCNIAKLYQNLIRLFESFFEISLLFFWWKKRNEKSGKKIP